MLIISILINIYLFISLIVLCIIYEKTITKLREEIESTKTYKNKK